MKKKHNTKFLRYQLGIIALSAGVATAGVEEMTTSAPVTPPADDVISGVLKLDFNSHFVSYGADVWSDGSSMSDPIFNPSIELSFALPNDFTFTLGTWWDVNTKNADFDSSPLGGRVQEVDVYAGLSYSFDKLTVGVTYQAWMYGGETEDILDIKFAYDTFLSPSLTIHHRMDVGGAAATGGNEGTILVLGLSHGVDVGPVSLSFPVNVAYFLDDDFHGGTDDGFGYVSAGVAASLPLTPYIGDAYGDWSLNGHLTYYITDDDVIPGNPKDDFLTVGLGLAVNF